MVQLIAIKIVDAEKKVVKTFIAKKELIVSQMKYFKNHLDRDSETSEIVDIQVCLYKS